LDEDFDAPPPVVGRVRESPATNGTFAFSDSVPACAMMILGVVTGLAYLVRYALSW